MSASFYDLMRYAATGIASPDMTGFDKLRARAAFGGYPVRTITGVPPISFKSDGKPLAAWSIAGNGQQSGTPTPDAPIMPEECGDRTGNLWDGKSTLVLPDIGTRYGFYCAAGDYSVRNDSENTVYMFWNNGRSRAGAAQPHTTATITVQDDGATGFFMPYNDASLSNITIVEGSDIPSQQIPYGFAIPISCAGQTVPVYLGQAVTTRRVRKLVLTGTENFTDYSYGCYMTLDHVATSAFCTHLENLMTQFQLDTPFGYFKTNQNAFAMHFSGISAADFKTFLAAQYAAGTPVTIWYVLATPTTGIVNEPLAKIGDYADELHSADAGILIPTAKGENTLTVDTDLPPSSVSITGHIK